MVAQETHKIVTLLFVYVVVPRPMADNVEPKLTDKDQPTSSPTPPPKKKNKKREPKAGCCCCSQIFFPLLAML